MSITAVPIRPAKRSTILNLAIGGVALVAVAVGFAWAGTAKIVNASLPSSAYMAKNGHQSGVVTTPSGLQYKVLSQGPGPKPLINDTVAIEYVGKLVDGTVFDSSEANRAPVVMHVNQVVPGFSEALQLMPQGSKYRLWIPPQLAYGPEAQGPIPADSVLVFDLTLVAIAPR